ncbi:DUF979 domain-containing protein [Goodfellowiella coeruleoviolacea]|uniref:Membrane protein n=1 Tax=Goodfellowiella coeruleoviolacea TaxID=334858 RepID=A0AAE3KJT8_9PSEU|nr:DUF979 domain-containing protein [Goodfellowiella coeruleoviolacea]MCP2164693.1 putative membrane protein [Goodfellowiella coeruleoviolacea]
MINAEWLYWLCGLLFLVAGVLAATDRSNPKRRGSALFWALLGVCFCYSTFVVARTAPAWPLGAAVLVLAGLAGFGRLGRGSRGGARAADRREAAGAHEPAGGRSAAASQASPEDQGASGDAEAGPVGSAAAAGPVVGGPVARGPAAGGAAARGPAAGGAAARGPAAGGAAAGGAAAGGAAAGGTAAPAWPHATTSASQRRALAARLGNRLFLPALLIPVVAALFATLVARVRVAGQPLLAEGTATLVGLGAGSVLAVLLGLVLFRPVSPLVPVREGSRLLEDIGWAALLPQMLATLGLLFDKAGVGRAVASITNGLLPEGSLLGAVVLYCAGMALFSVIMGNAFAAFPVMTAAIGWPVLVAQFHGDPALVFAVGMLAGFCGTLCTPMAANYNIVPAALLQLKDQYGPIKAQLPTAVPLLGCNILIMYFLAF